MAIYIMPLSIWIGCTSLDVLTTFLGGFAGTIEFSIHSNHVGIAYHGIIPIERVPRLVIIISPHNRLAGHISYDNDLVVSILINVSLRVDDNFCI